MDVSKKEILRELLKLPSKDRMEIVRRALESIEPELEDAVDPEIEEAWKKEAERRIRDIRSGKVKTIPWSEARKQLMAIGGHAKRKRRA